MSTFSDTKDQYSQEHFTIIEIDLPVVDGTCTVSGLPGYGTPLSCDQSSNGTKTYKFTNTDAPQLRESGILRLITGINESPTKLITSKGLSSRGTVTISMIDQDIGDPNPFAPAVIEQGEDVGTYLAKFKKRNVLANKEIRIKNYRVESDGTIDLVNGAETRYYVIEAMDSNKGKWSIKCKDELSVVNINETVWPLPLDGYLRVAINNSTQIFNVDPNVSYVVGDTIRIGDEFSKVTGITDILGAGATITVGTRGSSISYTNTLTRTVKDSHTDGDEIFVCEVSDDERITDLLERILLDVGVDASFIPKAAWDVEVDEWHPTTRVNTLWIESEDTNEVLEKILSAYMLNMWFDPVDREIKLSAISAWKESTATLAENNEIDFNTVTKKADEPLRATRALVIYDKGFLARSDSVENYSKGSIFKRTELEVADLYGKPKTKLLGFNNFIDDDSADLLVNRWVNRYIDPQNYTWKTQERKLSFSTGDVVTLETLDDVGFNGLPSANTRAQITSIKPSYKKYGREYMVTAESYEPLFLSGSEIVITGNISDINLFIEYAGAPSQAVDLTFIFDGAIGGGTSSLIPAIKAGNFASGSKLIIILANGADLQGKGGDGGNGATLTLDGGTYYSGTPSNGKDAGVVFDCQGVDVDFYFSGATPSANYSTADGYIRAPSGGSGGFNTITSGDFISGAGGDGGSGRNIGLGGETGLLGGRGISLIGIPGADGSSTSGWGVAGDNNDATGGAAGSGIVDGGGTVTFYGDTADRYINGNGDH